MEGNNRELACTLVVLLVSALVAGAALHLQGQATPAGQAFSFLPRHLIPSVMFACGHGFRTIQDDGVCQQLDDFINARRQTFEASDLPDNLTFAEPTSYTKRHAYLFRLLGVSWRICGIDWHVTQWVMMGMLCAASLAAYAFFRTALSRIGSTIGALLFASSPMTLFHIMHVRDFSKAPFFLVVIWGISALLVRPRRFPVQLALAAACGLAIGVGWGFRNDLVVGVPPVLLVLAFCRMAHPKLAWAKRGAVLAIFLITMLVSSWPIRASYDEAGNPTFDIMMGMASPIEMNLGLEPGSYQWLYTKRDDYVLALQNAFSQQALDSAEPVMDLSTQSEEVGRTYLTQLVLHFPHDLLLRTFASTLGVLGSFEDGIRKLSAMVSSGDPDAFPTPGRPFWVVVGVLTFSILALWRLREAFIFLLVFVFFAAAPSLQFEHRHFFHLIVFPIMGMLFLAEKAVSHVYRCHSSNADRPAWSYSPRKAARRLVFFWGLLATPSLAVWFGTAAWQYQSVTGIADNLAKSERALVETESETWGQWTVHRPKNWCKDLYDCRGTGMAPFRHHYCAVRLAAPLRDTEFWLMYDSQDIFGDFSKPVCPRQILRTDSGIVYFFPVFEAMNKADKRWNRFAGVALPKDQAHLFRGLYLVKDLAQCPLLLCFALPDAREALRSRQHIRLVPAPWPSQELLTGLVPGSPAYDIRVARFQRDLGQPDRTIAQLMAILEQGVDGFQIRMTLAESLEEHGRHAESLEHYTAALDYAPHFYAPYAALRRWFAQHGTAAAQLSFWKEVVHRHPGAFRAYCCLAKALEERKEIRQAIKAYEKACALSPPNPRLDAEYASLLARSGKAT